MLARMPNVLGVPAKRSVHIELHDGVRAYLQDAYPDIDASLFAQDLDAWSRTRDACITGGSPDTRM
mgnify:CR=1 FL=1